MRAPRYVIGYTPPPSSPLARFGAGVLGYDCFERVDVAHSVVPRLEPSILASATAELRRCGFNATLVAPFRLAGSHQDDLVAAFDLFVRSHAPVPVGPLVVSRLDSYVALVPAELDARVSELATACVMDFDRFVAPLTQEERDRRKTNGLSKRQLELLQRWGHPYVLDQFRFHMRLAGPLPGGEVGLFAALLASAYAGLAGDHLELDAISLLRQDDPDQRFFVVTRQRLTGAPAA